MTAIDRTSLYRYFITGAKPTQSQFDDLIDSCLNLATTSAQSIASDISVSGQAFFNNAIIVGSAAGGNKGVGTINATGIYVNGTLITTTSAGGSGTVTTGVSGQIAVYSSNSNTVGGVNALPNGTTATTQPLNDNSTDLATTAYADRTAFSTQTDVTASRSVSTVFRNTTGKTMFVNIAVTTNVNQVMSINSDSNPVPITNMGNSFVPSNYVTFGFIVPNNNYYQLTGQNTGAMTIGSWVESH